MVSCFEYRTDGDLSQQISATNHNLEILDGLYPFTCRNNNSTTLTIDADEYVEVRMVFGAEKNERFDWTRFEVGGEEADVEITKISSTTQIEAGKTVDYLLSVTNNGPSNATAVDILDALPVELNSATATWICLETGGASCAAATGTGDVSLIGNTIPVGGTVSVLLTARVQPDTPDGTFTNEAMAELTSGVDPVGENNLSERDIEVITIIDMIFEDSFEDTP